MPPALNGDATRRWRRKGREPVPCGVALGLRPAGCHSTQRGPRSPAGAGEGRLRLTSVVWWPHAAACTAFPRVPPSRPDRQTGRPSRARRRSPGSGLSGPVASTGELEAFITARWPLSAAPPWPPSVFSQYSRGWPCSSMRAAILRAWPGWTRSSRVLVRKKARGSACPEHVVVGRDLGQRGPVFGLVGIAVLGHPRRAGQQQVEALHVQQRHGRPRH